MRIIIAIFWAINHFSMLISVLAFQNGLICACRDCRSKVMVKNINEICRENNMFSFKNYMLKIQIFYIYPVYVSINIIYLFLNYDVYYYVFCRKSNRHSIFPGYFKIKLRFGAFLITKVPSISITSHMRIKASFGFSVCA